MVLDTDEVFGSTLGAADSFKIGIDDENKLGSLAGSLEGYNFGIPKGALLGDKIEGDGCGD